MLEGRSSDTNSRNLGPLVTLVTNPVTKVTNPVTKVTAMSHLVEMQ